MNQRFLGELLKLGILKDFEQKNIWNIARHCAAVVGTPMAIAIGAKTAGAGTVVLPGVGTVSAGVAGALAGLFTGTLSCTMVNVSLQKEIQRLAKGK